MPEGKDNAPSLSVGEAVCRHILEIEGITRDRLASALGISRRSVSDLVNDRRAVTAPIALRLARVLGTTPQYWMDMQRDVDLRVALQDMSAEFEALPVLRCPRSAPDR